MSEPAKKPKIALPSFRDVQAAQRATKAAPNLFQGRANDSNTSQGLNNSTQNASNSSTQNASRPSVATGVFADDPQSSASNRQSNFSAQPGPSHNFGQQMPQQNQGFRQSSSNAGPSGSFGASGASFHPPAQPMVDYNAMNASPNAILVSKRQEGNPLLKHLRNVRWAYADIVPDYVMGAETCALFLSMRFHLLKPDYIYHRIKELANSFQVRILMCHVDIDDVVEPLLQITRAAILNNVTLICGWSPEECARYLETYKAFETKPADSIKGHTDEDFLSRLNAALTTIRGVNKTDVLTLGSTFKTAASIMQASAEDLAACPGIGPTKVQRLHDTFHKPFRKSLKPVAVNNIALTRIPTVTDTQRAAAVEPVLDTMDMAEEIEDSDNEDYD